MVDFKQGIIADFKCRSWWEKNYPDEKYKEDHITALILHALSWTFAIYIPPFITAFLFDIDLEPYACIIIVSYMINFSVHFAVDDQKANELTLSLTQDQYIHLFQIAATAVMFIILFGA
jgi:hypothetical protein